MIITNYSTQIEFAAQDTKLINKADILAITIDYNDNYVYVLLNDNAGVTCGYLRIDYREITIPSVSTAEDLFDTLSQYNVVTDHQVFVATASQTDFTVTSFGLNDSYKIFVDGAYQSFGHSRTNNVITFINPVPEGTEIMVQQ